MFRRLSLLFLTLALASPLAAQKAPLLTVWPRAERVRQLELRADLSMIRKQYWQAIDSYKGALELDPNNAVLLNKTGIAYHQLLRFKDAKKFYQRATKAQPSYAQAWNNLGSVYYGEKNYGKAAKYYKRAIDLSPAQAAIRTNLGAALFARKKYDQAIEQFRVALLLNPNIFQERGRFGVLMQDYTVEDRARFHFVLAKAYAQLADVEKCLLYLRRALEEGYPPEQAQADEAFYLVREDKRFATLFAAPPKPIAQ